MTMRIGKVMAPFEIDDTDLSISDINSFGDDLCRLHGVMAQYLKNHGFISLNRVFYKKRKNPIFAQKKIGFFPPLVVLCVVC
jgi:hypothetical protein